MSINKDQVKGRVEEVKGSIKEAAGKIVGNPSLQAKGNIDKNSASLRRNLAPSQKT